MEEELFQGHILINGRPQITSQVLQLLRNSFFQFIVCLVTLFLVELKKEFQATLKMSVVVSNNEGLGVGFLVSQNSHAYRVLFVRDAPIL